MTGSFFASGNKSFKLVSISVPCRLMDTEGKGISDADIELYCLDLLSGKEILHFSGRSRFTGDFDLISRVDTADLPEVYVYKLIVRTSDFKLEKIVEGNPVQSELLNQFNPIVLASGKNASLFESTWVAQLESVSRDKYTTNAYMRDKALVLDDVVYLTINSNVSADVYVNNEYVGLSPIELTLSPDSANGVYFIRLNKNGYEDRIIVVDLSDVDVSNENLSIEEFIEMNLLD